MRPQHQLLHGPALAAVLKLLEPGPQSGYQLSARLRVACPQAITLGEASLYALLHYMEAHRLVSAAWSETDGQRRRSYQLTEHGRRRLDEETRQWQSLTPLFLDSNAVHQVRS